MRPSDIWALACTSKSLYGRVTQEVGEANCLELGRFIDRLSVILGDQKELLAAIKSSFGTIFPDRSSLRQGIFAIKEKLIDVLKPLDKAQLRLPEGLPIPTFLQDIFTLVAQYEKAMRVSRTHLISDPYRSGYIGKRAANLARGGAVEHAIELVTTFKQRKDWQDRDLQSIVSTLAEVGHLEPV